MKQDLIDQLKRLAMGRMDAAEALADLLMPDPVEIVALPVVESAPEPVGAPAPAKTPAKKAAKK